jgi:hypothetical protein
MATANGEEISQTYVLVTDSFLAMTGAENGDVEELNERLGSKAMKTDHILKGVVSGFNYACLRNNHGHLFSS